VKKIEHDFTKYCIFLDQYLCSSWNNIPINQSDLREKLTVYVKFMLTTRVRCFYTSVIHLSFPSYFRDKLGLGMRMGGKRISQSKTCSWINILVDNIPINQSDLREV